MTVNRYIFQSPYSSQIQIGRPDSSASKSEDSSTSSKLSEETDTTLQKSQEKELQAEELQPIDSSNQLLNIYA